MRICWWVTAAMWTLALSGTAQTIVNTDFSAPWVNVGSSPKVFGPVPQGWSDNSTWAALQIRHSRLLDGEQIYWRSEVSALESGWGQLQHGLPRITDSGYYRLKVRARSTSELSISYGIRRTGPPYNYLWQETRALLPRWGDFTVYARVDAAAYDVAFYIAINGAGAIDLAAFQLEKLSEAQLIEEFTHSAAGLPKNLLRNTRFPLGLPAGWLLDRDSSDQDDVIITSEDDALHVQGSHAWQISTEPFAAPKPRVNYTVSFYARGDASGQLVVINEGRYITSRSFRATPERQRFSLAFNAPLLSRAQALRIEATGGLWMDSFQLEEGSAATEFSPPDCELHLASDSPIRTAFDDEPLTLRYTVLGGETCARVKLAVEDLSGEMRDLPVDGLTGETVLPGGYGAYRIEGLVEDANGNPAGPYQELTLFHLRRPRYWMTDAPNSPFGVHTNSTTRHILMAKAAGINWTRLHDAGLQYIGWYHLERQPSEWTFQDADLLRYRQYGLKVLGLLSTAPEWASYFDKPHNGYFDRFYQPRNLEQYAHYVRVVTQRYQGVIDTWDVWNEPWNVGWWAVRYDEAGQKYVTSEHPQADFARLQTVAFEAAKSVDPALTILGINSTTGATGTAWTKGVVDAGGLNAADVLCYHQYTSEPLGFPGDAAERGWRDATSPAMIDGAVSKPVWMTEGSPIYSISGSGFYRRILPFEESENFSVTSDRLVRHVVALLAQGVQKVFLYSMHSHAGIAGNPNPWRVILGADGYLHPNAAAHSAMAWFLEDTRFTETLAAAPSVTAYIFGGSSRAVAVLAPKPGGATDWTPPEGLERFDLYGNPLPAGAPSGRAISHVTLEGDAATLAAMLRGGSQ